MASRTIQERRAGRYLRITRTMCVSKGSVMPGQALERSFIGRWFVRRPVVTAIVFTIVMLLATGGLRTLAGLLIARGPHHAQVAAGVQQLVLAAVLIVVLVRSGWARPSLLSSRPRLPHMWQAWPVVGTAVVMLGAIPSIDWSKTSQIAASTFDFGSTGLVEELGMRGLVFTGLRLGFRGRPRADLKAVLLSSAMFGVMHLSPVAVVFAFVYGLGFALLAVATRSIWPGIVVHFVFDLFSDLPGSTADHRNGLPIAISLLLVLISAVLSVALFARRAEEPLTD
jgi:membrane protease YdiL (CAAX protease family)